MLGSPVVLFSSVLGEGSPTKIDYSKKGTRILTSLLEDLVWEEAFVDLFEFLDSLTLVTCVCTCFGPIHVSSGFCHLQFSLFLILFVCFRWPLKMT